MSASRNNDIPLLDDHLTPEELAAELNISARTLARWEALGEAPPHRKIGRRVLYCRASVRKWIESREREPA